MIYSALFHDAYDHKYVKNESHRESLISEISDFLKNIGIDENGIEIIHAIISDISFSEYLLEQIGVAVVPGSAFGSEGYVRLSFATSMDNLKNALDRIEKLLS